MLAALAGCGDDDRQYAPADVCRLDLVLAGYDALDSAARVSALDSLRPEIDAMFGVLGVDSVSVPMLCRWSVSDVVTVFQPDVDSVFASVSTLGRQLGAVTGNAAALDLGIPPVRFVSVVWGSRRPVVRVGDIVLVALNHYLGADYPGYAQWPDFRRSEKQPDAIPYDVAAVLVATQYPFDVSRQNVSLLDWMLYEGALVECRMRLVEGARLDRALGYTPEQLKFCEDNLREMWREMATRRMLYSEDAQLIDRMVAPAPASPLMESRAPGRVGRYIGYRIVRAYLDRHPDTRLRDLLQPQFYADRQSLIDASFNP